MNIIIIRLLIGFVINLMFGMIAFMREMVDDTGLFAGVLMFTLVYVFMDWQGYVIVMIFFILTGAAINIENKDKANKGHFELYKAKRSLNRVLGRSLAGAVFAGMFFLTNRPEYKIAFVASYAESMFDTISTKMGKLIKYKTLLITTLKPVNPGTRGGVSLPGILFGLVGAIVIGAAGTLVRLIEPAALSIVIIGTSTGVFTDSFLNAVGYQKKRLPKEVINFFSSIIAGIICILIFWLCAPAFGVKVTHVVTNPIFFKIDYKPNLK